MGEGQPADKGEGGTCRAGSSVELTPAVPMPRHYPIHLKGFIRRRQETLVSRMENLEQFCPVWGESSTSNTDFCRVPHICASSLELLPDSHPV